MPPRRPKAAVTIETLAAVVFACGHLAAAAEGAYAFVWLRNRALFLISFFGLLRRSEVMALRRRDLIVDANA